MDWSQGLLLGGAIAVMVAIVPLMVWGGTGDWRHAMLALKEYLLVMLVLAVPAIVGVVITLGDRFLFP